MIDYAARRALTLVTGKSGTGKTTFALRHLAARTDFRARLIFDPDRQASDRLGIPAVDTAEELPMALEDGWVIFDPNTLFPGNHAAAFAWFCDWTFNVCGEIPGLKIMLVDEVWKYCSPTAIPPELASCIQTGRVRNLEMMFATQRPNRLNEAITNEVTELVCFRLQGENALKRVADLGAPAEEVAGLAPGKFVSVNLDTGAECRGQVF